MQITPCNKSLCKDFNSKNLDKYHDLYLGKDTLLLVNAFDSFWNVCLEIYRFYLTHFFSEP